MSAPLSYVTFLIRKVTKRFFNNENITDLFLDNCSELILTDGDTYYYVENNYNHKKICEEIINKFKKDESHDLYYSVNNTNINRSNFEMNELKRVGLGCRIGTFFNNGYIKKYNKLIKLSHNPDNLYTIKNNSYLYENETDETRKNFNLELMFLKEIVTIKLKKIVTIKLKKHDSNQNERDFDDLMFDILEQTAFGDKKNINCFNTIFKMIEDFVINYSSDGSNSKSYFNAIHINKIDINFFSKLYSDILFINLIDCAKNKADVLNSIKQVCVIIFPMITFPYASRILGAGNYGKVSFGLSIISYLSLIAALGIANYSIREGARIRNDIDSLQKLVSQIFTLNLEHFIISYIRFNFKFLNFTLVCKITTYLNLQDF